MKSKILLEDIKIYAYHGVLPEEALIGNNYIINAELHADLEKASNPIILMILSIMLRSAKSFIRKWQSVPNFWNT
jgi:hypothetical protein